MEEQKKDHVSEELRDRYKWKKIHAPKTWRPKAPGEELIGFYGGKTQRQGSYGQYEVVLVHVPLAGTKMITGVQIIQLVDASTIDVGWPIRIVWGGVEKLENDRTMKKFEVFVAEGDPVSPEDLPLVQQR